MVMDAKLPTGAASTALWCAAWSREAGESPVGTAVGADRFVLIELPLPWPAAIELHPLLADALLGQDLVAARVLAVGCEGGCSEEHTVICYWRDPAQPFAGFNRSETKVPRERLGEVVRGLVAGDDLRGDVVPGVADFLICTHGSRDRCCGKMGGRLFEDLRRESSVVARLWRTSHTGGHRFAPTGITFPDGMTWAGLDLASARGILGRTLAVDQVVPRLRGCAGLRDGLAQAADAEGFARHGWDWLTTARDATVVGDDGNCAEIRVDYRTDGGGGSFEAQIERGRTLPIVACGAPIAAALKTTTELVVRRVR